jgi:hypothetical protein
MLKMPNLARDSAPFEVGSARLPLKPRVPALPLPALDQHQAQICLPNKDLAKLRNQHITRTKNPDIFLPPFYIFEILPRRHQSSVPVPHSSKRVRKSLHYLTYGPSTHPRCRNCGPRCCVPSWYGRRSRCASWSTWPG